MLTATLFLPLAGALLILLFVNGPRVRLVAAAVTIVELVLTSVVFFIVYQDGTDVPPAG